MTIKEKIYNVITNVDKVDMDADTINKLIKVAYYMGREDAAKVICDDARTIFAEQAKRAGEFRYHNLAMRAQGDVSFVYSGDYAGTYTQTFGDDITTL